MNNNRGTLVPSHAIVHVDMANPPSESQRHDDSPHLLVLLLKVWSRPVLGWFKMGMKLLDPVMVRSVCLTC